MRHKSTELMGTIKAFVEEYYKNYRHSPSTTEIVDARTSQNLTRRNLIDVQVLTKLILAVLRMEHEIQV